jgi:Flp pilus assembly pilin Flp
MGVSVAANIRSAIWCFVKDDDAQDLVEYALLCAFIGLCGIAIWQNIVTLMGTHYTTANVEVENLWASPDP